ncbi:MAG: RuBisCO large subunit C-terminal-like domain-containing protein [Smithellaceae bacterium]|nr:RuBisCO large subunit C-terminal-like domain-containing protein [Smithellaceae bacterium]
MEKYADSPYALPEGIDMEKHIIATYYTSWPKELNIDAMSPVLAIEQSTGTWTPTPMETPEIRAAHVAKVIGVYETPFYEWRVEPGVTDRHYVIQLAFPSANIESQIPMLFTAAIGNISMAGKLKLIDIRMPKDVLAGYQGPKFGIDGIYKALGIKKRRPLLNNMIKPCSGYPLEVGADLFRKAALGGCDVVKDDELIGDMKYNGVLQRVKAYLKIEKEVFEETGEHTLYTVNVTDRLPKMFELAKAVKDAGGNALMVNYWAIGPEAMRALAEDKNINLPIIAHMDFSGALYMSPEYGMSSHLVLGKIPRLCGADMLVLPFALGGKAMWLMERFSETARSLTYPMANLKPTMPMPSGGITPANVPDTIRELGTDIMIGSGGGIHAHPLGTVAGAKAFRQAIDAVMKGVPIAEYGKEHEELGRALGTWGVKTEFKI